MIKSIQELSDIELRVVVMNATGYSRLQITELLNISDFKLSKILASINEKCGAKNIEEALDKMSLENII